MHEDPAATSDVPSDPFAMKTMPLSAETSTWGPLAERTGKKPKGQTSRSERRAALGRGSVLTFGRKLMEGGGEQRPERGKANVTQDI